MGPEIGVDNGTPDITSLLFYYVVVMITDRRPNGLIGNRLLEAVWEYAMAMRDVVTRVLEIRILIICHSHLT